MALAKAEQAAQRYAAAARASGTETGYARDWADFERWCAACGLVPLPALPETIAVYLADRAATLRPGTLQRRLASIVVRHRREGMAVDTRDPRLREVWRGIRRVHGTASSGRRPLIAPELRVIVSLLPNTMSGIRDRAILLLGFSGALRRSELVGLDVGDLTFMADGLVLAIRRSKTDPYGTGAQRAIPRGAHLETCPVAAVTQWMAAAHLAEGPLFHAVDRHLRIRDTRLGDKAVALIVKRAVLLRARHDGLPDAKAQQRAALVAGHSLRAGFATSGAAAGIDEWSLMEQTGHKRRESIRRYIRRGSLFLGNPAGKLGL